MLQLDKGLIANRTCAVAAAGNPAAAAARAVRQDRPPKIVI